MKLWEIAGFAILFILFNAIVTTGIRLSVDINNNPVVVRLLNWKKVYIYIDLFVVLAYLFYIIVAVNRKIETGFSATLDPVYYKEAFERANIGLLDFYRQDTMEPGYILLTWGIRHVTSNYRIFLLVIHSIAFTGTVHFVRAATKGIKTIFSWLVTFLCCSNLFYMFNITRSAMAIVICSNALYALTEKKIKRALFLLVIACSIHVSSVIILPVIVYRLMQDKLNANIRIWHFIAIQILAEFAAMVVIRRIISGSRYHIYSNLDGLSVRTYLVTIFVIIAISVKERYGRIDERSHITKQNIAFTLTCIPIQCFYSVAYRMTLLFFPSIYVGMLYLFEDSHIIKPRKITRESIFGLAIALLYCVYKFYSIFFVEIIKVYPYANELLIVK